MSAKNITETIKYIGVDDREIRLFEGQYGVPNGMSYNSYLILDENTVLMDTVDRRASGEWLENLTAALDGRTLDYLVISHLEPDHAANIPVVCERYPDMKIVGNAKTFQMFGQFFDVDISDRAVTVAEGDTLNTGAHTLTFIMAPMIHWPEVMVTYDSYDKVLFSADGFGKFGTIDTDEDWTCEARRYYFNIVGKYGAQVQNLLKKAAGLDISIICPLHGPILTEDLGYYIGKYDTWSSYRPEDKGILIAYASIHGHTAEAAYRLKEMLEKNNVEKVAICDLARDDMAEAVEDAFRYDRLIVASASYDAGLFPCMEKFLLHLKAKNYQKRTVAIVENGSWAPSAGKCMKNILDTMKEITLVEPIVTVRSALNADSLAALEKLAQAMS